MLVLLPRGAAVARHLAATRTDAEGVVASEAEQIRHRVITSGQVRTLVLVEARIQPRSVWTQRRDRIRVMQGSRHIIEYTRV